MGNTKDWLKFRLWVVPHFPSGIVQWVKCKCAQKYIVSPHVRKAGHPREREKWGTRDKAFAFDFALLSQRVTVIGSSMAICQKLSKMCQLLMTAQWEKESHRMPLIDLKDDKNFTLQNQWVGREESKAWALSVVPNFSLSRPRLAFLMWGDTMYFHMHLHFARSTIPEGNWGTTRSLPQVASLTIITNSAAGREGKKIFTIHYLCLLSLVNPVKIFYCLFCLVITAVHSLHIIIISFLFLYNQWYKISARRLDL